jgi:peptidoglycan/LPS O-acetylase OafA/YrhL
MYGFSAALILLGIAQWKTINNNLFSRFFLLLGDASYSLYLVHPIVLAFLFKLITRMGIHRGSNGTVYGLYLLASTSCVLTGILLHKIVERPLLQTLNKHRQRNKPYQPVG